MAANVMKLKAYLRATENIFNASNKHMYYQIVPSAKYCQAISHVNVELASDVSETVRLHHQGLML
jgi:uncharacterized protein YjaG (DUF416 family)